MVSPTHVHGHVEITTNDELLGIIWEHNLLGGELGMIGL